MTFWIIQLLMEIYKIQKFNFDILKYVMSCVQMWKSIFQNINKSKCSFKFNKKVVILRVHQPKEIITYKMSIDNFNGCNFKGTKKHLNKLKKCKGRCFWLLKADHLGL